MVALSIIPETGISIPLLPLYLPKDNLLLEERLILGMRPEELTESSMLPIRDFYPPTLQILCCSESQ